MNCSVPSEDVTGLLHSWSDGNQSALEKLIPLVYAELHRLASGYMQREREDHTLQTTALINEAFLKLVDCRKAKWQNRAHFFGISARLMRQILVDFARAQQSTKRGGAVTLVELNEEVIPGKYRHDVMGVNDALSSLEAQDPRKARIVELRYFGGLSVKETAEVMKISLRTVEMEWSLAQAWLLRELSSPAKKVKTAGK